MTRWSALIFTVTGTTAPSQRHAIRAKSLASDFHHFKTAAPFAFAGLLHSFGRLGFHSSKNIPPQAFAKFSASAMALRMDMDLLTVS
jgi:hypothetical protein